MGRCDSGLQAAGLCGSGEPSCLEATTTLYIVPLELPPRVVAVGVDFTRPLSGTVGNHHLGTNEQERGKRGLVVPVFIFEGALIALHPRADFHPGWTFL